MTRDRLTDLTASFAVHDDLVARRGVDVWVGAEPTFTRSDSPDAAWSVAAEGDDKLSRAHDLATHFAAQHPGATVTRILGRHFPDETAPRFAFGVRWPDCPAGDIAYHSSHITHVEPSRATGDADGQTDLSDVGHHTSYVVPVAGTVPVRPPSVAELEGDHWLTVTPDPGVVEVNMAPCGTVQAFAAQAEAVWQAAGASGLSAVRCRYNGDVTDSGGGGQLSIGGATPASSPFVRYPHVLPALIRYFNNHPSLSFWFANECVGSASQGPRPDEGTPERWDELGVTLDWLERLADQGELLPDQMWSALGPLLVDCSGNAHRAELNVEKLWNPHIAPHGTRHGRMGIVELRAVRMPERPTMLAALAVLVRSIVARLVVAHYRAPLVDWHDELHDRFALPAALSRDLRMVLGDLDEHGLGVPAQLRRELEAWRKPGITCRLGDATLTLRPALEFWPLVGDVASQERSTARIVDASTQRWELAFDGAGPECIAVAGKWAHLRSIGDGVRAVGVRRRVFQPTPGLHPGLPAMDPLVIEWSWANRTQRIELWAWKPTGGPYPALPRDATEALARRTERVCVTTSDGETASATGHWTEGKPFTIDLRGAG
jgi:uncharacterized protein (DUF2126 family)